MGTRARSHIVPGAKEYCFSLKTSQDSKRLRTAIGEALEYASRPDVKDSYYANPVDRHLARMERRRRVTFVIVGGGATGVELAGEMNDFFRQICRTPDGAFQHLSRDISIVLIHSGNELLPTMNPPLRQRAQEAMLEQGIQLRLNTRLQQVTANTVVIKDKHSGQEETLDCGLVVWGAGNEPVPFVQTLLKELPPEAAGTAGRVNVDSWLRCPTNSPNTFGSILVLGDAACTPEVLPQTAQVAGQQGAYVARMLNRSYNLTVSPPALSPMSQNELSLLRMWLLARGLKEAPEFTYLSLGLLAYVGGGEALNQVELGKVPIFDYFGEVAFALWRSVYLTKQASSKNQALIAFDWLRTETFGRDITRL